MSLTDQLKETSPPPKGVPCVFERLRDVEGVERYLEVIELVKAPGFEANRKQDVLAANGYVIDVQSIRRHARNQCSRCARWLS